MTTITATTAAGWVSVGWPIFALLMLAGLVVARPVSVIRKRRIRRTAMSAPDEMARAKHLRAGAQAPPMPDVSPSTPL